MSGNLKVAGSPKISGIYRALVEDVDDTEKLGRVKARVYPMFSDIEIGHLPWAVPAFGLFEGAGEDMGSFTVPDVGNWVFVFFEAGDPYQPVYFANAPTGADSLKGLPVSRETNYPTRRVWRTSSGIEVYIDNTDTEIYVSHPATCTMKIDKDGNIEVETVGKIDVSADGEITVNTKENANVNTDGNTNVTATGNVVVKGATIQLN